MFHTFMAAHNIDIWIAIFQIKSRSSSHHLLIQSEFCTTYGNITWLCLILSLHRVAWSQADARCETTVINSYRTLNSSRRDSSIATSSRPILHWEAETEARIPISSIYSTSDWVDHMWWWVYCRDTVMKEYGNYCRKIRMMENWCWECHASTLCSGTVWLPYIMPTVSSFSGTTRYCSAAANEKADQGRVDDLWSLLYVLVELRGPLPWKELKYVYSIFYSNLP